MYEIILKVDGMKCGMCEAHVNDAVRDNFNVKKVKSSHSKGQTVILTEEDMDEIYQTIFSQLYLSEGEGDL